MAETKKRRISSKDWDRVEKHVKAVYDDRKSSNFRREHERIWKEVDRQISMKPMARLTADGKQIKNTWHNAIELGELAKASEIITSDVMRIIFQQDKPFFQPHVELAADVDPQSGTPSIDEARQEVEDGLLRAFMAQQHKDFGLKARFRLSVKECLHHGSAVAEVRFENQLMVRNGSEIKSVGAPVWVPYSMWNAYPDPSPSVIGANLFYTGSMILVEYKKYADFKRLSGEGWIQERMKLVERRNNKNREDDTDDVELIKYKGDICIERSDGDDIYLPNSEVILANDKLVYYSEGELPYPNIIYFGYERQDVRDPYYTSPIIKQSPTHRMTTYMANKFMDATALKIEPPIEYDANDPDYVSSDGPLIAPGAKTATRSMGKGFTALDIGDPRFALDAYTLGMRQMQEGLGVSALRAGVREADRETATSANLANQGAEVRTMEFVSQLEPQALLPFLYMQHELNRKNLTTYTFYNDEMHTPDFVRISKQDIQEDVHFDVTGSRGVLGEEKRDRKFAETTAFLSGNPLFAPKLNDTEIMLKMYRDSGEKNPEKLVKTQGPQVPPQVQQAMQQAQATIKELAAKLQEAEKQYALKEKEIANKQQEAALAAANDKAEIAIKANSEIAAQRLAQDELAAQIRKDSAELELARKELALERQKILDDRTRFEAEMRMKMHEIESKAMEKATPQKKKYRVNRNPKTGDIDGLIEDN